jgi:hypothetical protein
MNVNKYTYHIKTWCNKCKEYHNRIGNNFKLHEIFGYNFKCYKKLLKTTGKLYDHENNDKNGKVLKVHYYRNNTKITKSQWKKELNIK